LVDGVVTTENSNSLVEWDRDSLQWWWSVPKFWIQFEICGHLATCCYTKCMAHCLSARVLLFVYYSPGGYSTRTHSR